MVTLLLREEEGDLDGRFLAFVVVCGSENIGMLDGGEVALEDLCESPD